MCKHDAETIAKFIWNQLDLYPEETMGHSHLTQIEFAVKIMEIT